MDKIAGRATEVNIVLSSDEEETAAASDGAKAAKDAFYVDTGLIPQASLDEQGSSELHQLNLSVFNQDVFEQGVMEQVDHALAKEEGVRLRNILTRELTAISDDILMAKKDLERANAAESSIEDLCGQNRESRDHQRQLESIRKQKENKLKQLKVLKVRRENVWKKIASFETSVTEVNDGHDGGSTFDEAFHLGTKAKKESARERMIRTGEMTPFGTVVKATAKKPTKPIHLSGFEKQLATRDSPQQRVQKPTKPIHLSGFEKQLATRDSPQQRVQKDFQKYLKRKTEQASKVKTRKTDEDDQVNKDEVSVRVKKTNSFDKKDTRVYDKEPNYRQLRNRGNTEHQAHHHEVMEDGQISDEEGCESYEGDEDDYQPSKEDLQECSDDEEYADNSDECEDKTETGKRKASSSRPSFKKKKRRPLPKYRGNSDEDVPVQMKVKRDLSIRREKDDADPELYQQRLLKQQKLDRLEEAGDDNSDDGNGDEAEAEFDGGFQVPRKLWKKLFNYQKTGVRWLWELHCQQAGGIVGDEMGLGKTIQTISFLAALRTSKVKNVNFPYKGLGPTIIICPTTVMHQWLQEFHKWWPDFRVAILHSSGTFTGSESDMVRSVAKNQGILITSYNTLVIHQELVLRFNWHYVILDEGHKIRNPDAKVTLCCKQFRTPHRIILSGSPIQNNLKELWSLFDFVFPGKLGTLPDFMQHFSIPIVQGGYSNATQIQVETAYRCACVLRDTINPYLIRRMKADVKKNLDLPNKNEQVLFCRLTDEQRDVYQEYLDSRECNAILQGKFQVFTGLITLRKICNHPDLSTGGPRGQDEPNDPEYQFGYYKRSGKMIVVEALLRLWYKQKHRVLLFTQSKSMLNILEKFVQANCYPYLVMDGGTPIPARQPLVTQYNNDPNIYIFLLTTRVGGLGVNLTGADRVIIYDPDWNPSTDIQARERAWRIGQTRQVTIYRLLTSGTIEEKIYHRQIFKQFLTNRVLKDPKQRRLFKSQDMMELFTLGSKDNEEGTETSALFAGTNSDVKVPKRFRKNRFDEIQERKRKEAEDKAAADDAERKMREKEDKILEEEEEISLDLDSEELERMKEFARQLSRKMERDKIQRTVKDIKQSNPGSSAEQTLTIKQEKETENEAHPDSDNSEQEIQNELPTEHQKINYSKDSNTTSQLAIHSSQMSNGQMDIKKHNWQQDGKRWTIPTRKTEEDHGDQEVHRKRGEKTRRYEKELSVPSTLKQLPKKKLLMHDDDDDDERQTKRRKRKRRHHDAKMEGERIPHLVKHRPMPATAMPEDQDQQQREKTDGGSEHHDDYVLRQLFKKTGIQGAMKHDKIMDSGRPDYVIVEAEAARVAREAAAALRHSRQQCASALSGFPTWTGQHGGILKPRFGQKKNTFLTEKSSKSETATQGASTSQQKAHKDKEAQLFDGSISGNVSLSAKNNSMTSSDLLNRIRARKRLSALATDPEEDEDEFLRPDRPTTVEPKDEELLQDIRNYVAFMATKDGEATTQEIVLNFGKRLPKSDAPKFKAMLNQICDFQGGVWSLKPEFR